MARCEECIHFDVCYLNEIDNDIREKGENPNCLHFIPGADVAPKSEVEKLEKEVERLTNILNSYALQYGTVADKQKVIDRGKAEVAREIFEEIDESMIDHARGDIDSQWLYVRIEELKKKYAEEVK